MIGTLNPKYREATLVGAGMAGLLAAYALDQKGYRVTLIEAQSRAGGLIETRSTPWGIAEKAAHSLLATPAVLQLCRDLDVKLIEVEKKSRAKFILRNGKLRRFPLNPAETAAALCRFAWNSVTQKLKTSTSDPSLTLESWGLKNFGKPTVNYLLNPFVRGIYGAHPSLLSIHAVLGNSRKRTFGKMVAPENGMSALTQALERRLETRLNDRLKRGERLSTLPDVPNLILCTPSDSAAFLLRTMDSSLSATLTQIPYTPLISVTIFIQKSAFKRFRPGVGVLVPEAENQGACLGILFNSRAFKNRVNHEGEIESLTLMLGGSIQAGLLSESDQKILSLVEKSLNDILGFDGSLLHAEISRSPRAIPQYSPALLHSWEVAKNGWCSEPGRILFGNYTGQVSLRGMIETTQTLALKRA